MPGAGCAAAAAALLVAAAMAQPCQRAFPGATFDLSGLMGNECVGRACCARALPRQRQRRHGTGGVRTCAAHGGGDTRTQKLRMGQHARVRLITFPLSLSLVLPTATATATRGRIRGARRSGHSSACNGLPPPPLPRLQPPPLLTSLTRPPPQLHVCVLWARLDPPTSVLIVRQPSVSFWG